MSNDIMFRINTSNQRTPSGLAKTVADYVGGSSTRILHKTRAVYLDDTGPHIKYRNASFELVPCGGVGMVWVLTITPGGACERQVEILRDVVVDCIRQSLLQNNFISPLTYDFA